MEKISQIIEKRFIEGISSEPDPKTIIQITKNYFKKEYPSFLKGDFKIRLDKQNLHIETKNNFAVQEIALNKREIIELINQKLPKPVLREIYVKMVF